MWPQEVGEVSTTFSLADNLMVCPWDFDFGDTVEIVLGMLAYLLIR